MQTRWNGIESLLRDLAERFSSSTALSIRKGDHWDTLDFTTLEARARARARGLQQAGIRPGDRLALLGPASLEWPVELFAALLAGAVVLPLDQKLSETEHFQLLGHSEARFLVVSPEFRAEAFSLQSQLPTLEKVLFLEEPASPLFQDSSQPFPQPALKDCAAIFYTSGTLGSAKGVMVSFENILAELTMLTSLHENHPGDVLFTILPLNHLYGLIMMAYSLASGAELCFAHSLAGPDIVFCLRERGVTQLNVVPLLLSVLRRGVLQQLEQEPPLKRRIFCFLLRVGPYLPPPLRRRLFRPLHEKFGGRLRRVVSGAAPLDLETFDFFRAIGIPIYEGYGLTETGPVVSVNTTRHAQRGSVGRPLPGVEVRLEREEAEKFGEILTRGPHVMLGYYKNPETTREVLSPEGWFRTGDFGRLERGFLRITGRRKSLIVLESGKKVHAEEVEMALQLSPSFRDVCVLGSKLTGKGELVVAVVNPAPDLLAAFPQEAELLRKVETEVQQLSRRLAVFKRPARVVVRREEFPKTTSGKVKRHLLLEQLEGQI